MRATKAKQRGNLQKQLDDITEIINDEAKIIKVTDAALTVAQTNALLNGKYPGVGVYSEVFAPGVAGGTKYTKTTTNGWVSSSATALT